MTPKNKYKIISLPEFEGKTLEKVHEYLKATYPNQLPAAEDQEEFEKESHGLPVWTWYYFFGGVFRDLHEVWNVPFSGWGGASWYRLARWLSHGWDSGSRVVLLEIASVSHPLASESDPLAEPLELRVKALEEWARHVGYKH